MIALKSSRNPLIFEKYERLKSSKVHFLQNSPPLQLHISASNSSKSVGNILEAILGQPFQLVCRILHDFSSITKALSLHC